jgi:MFS-type transporter involved in bile tolerance (Atg22 family)
MYKNFLIYLIHISSIKLKIYNGYIELKMFFFSVKITMVTEKLEYKYLLIVYSIYLHFHKVQLIFINKNKIRIELLFKTKNKNTRKMSKKSKTGIKIPTIDERLGN